MLGQADLEPNWPYPPDCMGLLHESQQKFTSAGYHGTATQRSRLRKEGSQRLKGELGHGHPQIGFIAALLSPTAGHVHYY